MPKQIENMMISQAVSDGNFDFLEKYVKKHPTIFSENMGKNITNPKNGENILSTALKSSSHNKWIIVKLLRDNGTSDEWAGTDNTIPDPMEIILEMDIETDSIPQDVYTWMYSLVTGS
jgi:hypothetical protein